MVNSKSLLCYEKYYVIYDDGKIISLRTNKELSPSINKAGYKYVHLRDENGIDKKFLLHKLVADNFLIKPEPTKKLIIDHRNGNKTDNTVQNLQWITYSENTCNAHKHNKNIGNGNKRIQKLDINGNNIKQYNSIKAASIDNNIKKQSILRCLNNPDKKYTANGFLWKLCNKEKELKLEDNEIFKNIGKYKIYNLSNYEISNYGKIKNVKAGKFLKIPITNGYYRIPLVSDIDKKSISIFIHQLVATYFISNPPNDECVVNHKDENRLNNYYENLEWLTIGDNTIYSIAKPVHMIDIKTNEIFKTFYSIRDACRYLNIKYGSAISQCCYNKPKYETAQGYKWKFANNE